MSNSRITIDVLVKLLQGDLVHSRAFPGTLIPLVLLLEQKVVIPLTRSWSRSDGRQLEDRHRRLGPSQVPVERIQARLPPQGEQIQALAELDVHDAAVDCPRWLLRGRRRR